MIKLIADRVINRVLLKPLGLRLGYRVGSDPLEDMVSLLRSQSVSTIIDGGAYKGSFSRAVTKAFPMAAIHAFEPTPKSYEFLKKSTCNIAAIQCHRSALGSRSGRATLFANASPLTNSLRKTSVDGHRYFSEVVAEEGEFAVEVINITDFARAKNLKGIDIVKLDLQGNELDALTGMGALIDTVKLVHSEVQFVGLYKGAPMFADIESYLRQHNIILYQFYDMVRSPDDGRLLYGDATFARAEIFSHLQSITQAT